MGIVRAAELFKSCQILGIDTENVKVVEDPKLQDGFDSIWELDAVAHVVSGIVDQWKIDSIITFDDRGVSGHPNHIATWFGVKHMVEDKVFREKHNDFRVWKLGSTNFFRKYSGILDIFLSSWDFGIMFFSHRIWINYAAMVSHYSQFVWYRRLFIIFSRYDRLAPV